MQLGGSVVWFGPSLSDSKERQRKVVGTDNSEQLHQPMKEEAAVDEDFLPFYKITKAGYRAATHSVTGNETCSS